MWIFDCYAQDKGCFVSGVVYRYSSRYRWEFYVVNGFRWWWVRWRWVDREISQELAKCWHIDKSSLHLADLSTACT